ncbi:MAG TPA: substrate-binding domain-containing protein [Terriglobales bacterium]|jgi:ribose transport system substrate-binding protein|nr:substrate-binding domain-containing protein [Terriglobales bacterium]
MLRKNLFAAFATLIAITPILSCGTGHDAEEKYILISANLKIPYWQTAGAGFSQGASQLKVRNEFVGPDDYDPKAEAEALNRAISQKPTGILISAADPNLLKDGVDHAMSAGIPVITMDSDIRGSKRLFFIGTNNYQAGMTGGQRLATELKGKGNVVVFTIPEQTNMAERLRGYRDALESHPQIKITQVVDIKGDSRVAFDTTTQIIGKQKDKVDAFVCLEALAGKEVATVLSSNNVKDKVVIAMDTDPDTLDWIRKGVINATISQKPYTMALVGLRMLDSLYHHKLSPLDKNWADDSFAPIPAFVDTGSALIDKTNVEDFAQASKSATQK